MHRRAAAAADAAGADDAAAALTDRIAVRAADANAIIAAV